MQPTLAHQERYIWPDECDPEEEEQKDMSEPIIQGQEFPVVEPTAAKKLEETTSEDDYVRVRTVRIVASSSPIHACPGALAGIPSFSRKRKLLTLRQLDGATPTAASFQFDGEDHTLGNVLRYIIMKKQVPSSLPTFHARRRKTSQPSSANPHATAPTSSSAATRCPIRQRPR